MARPARTVTTPSGVPLAVHDLGGAGPTLVLAHASGFHGLVWRAVAAALADRFRCVAVDHRGHGDSGAPAGDDFSWAGFGEDLLAVVDGLGAGRPWGAGHSAGATALLLAEQARPGTFAGLYCFEPVLVPAVPPLGPDPASWLAAAARRRREVFASRSEAQAAYAARPPLAALHPAVLADYVGHGFRGEGGAVRLKCRREHEALIAEQATAHDGFVRLGEVGCPVVVACGSRSEALPPDRAAALAARLPDPRLDVVAGVGHLGPLEDPAAVAASIARTLGRAAGPP